MQDFAAIDFETANFERSSVCSVGVVIVRGGEIVDSFYSLIQPEPNYYQWYSSSSPESPTTDRCSCMWLRFNQSSSRPC